MDVTMERPALIAHIKVPTRSSTTLLAKAMKMHPKRDTNDANPTVQAAQSVKDGRDALLLGKFIANPSVPSMKALKMMILANHLAELKAKVVVHSRPKKHLESSKDEVSQR